MEKKKRDVKISEAADNLGVTAQTIRNWIRIGKIKATRTKGGHFRISQDEMTRIIRSPMELEAYHVCIVCRHQLNRHRDDGDAWRCHEMSCDLSTCECELMKYRGDGDILFYDLRSRWLDSIDEWNKDMDGLDDKFLVKIEDCPTCGGRGEYDKTFEDGDVMMFACPDCEGIGKMIVESDALENLRPIPDQSVDS